MNAELRYLFVHCPLWPQLLFFCSALLMHVAWKVLFVLCEKKCKFKNYYLKIFVSFVNLMLIISLRV